MAAATASGSAPGNGGHCVLAAAFEVEGRSVGSAHGTLEGRELGMDSLPMIEAVNSRGTP
jgi:hypothetical protein